ncbi:MAG TPA: hypothetical protein VM285_03610 [Polyangia bacterium]|nr:hypothetical protein [Polyangia bacterium]
MAFSDQDFVKLGARFGTQRMIEQARVSSAVARAHGEDLGGLFPVARTEEIEQLTEQIAGLFEDQAEKKYESNTGNIPVAELVQRGKAWIRRVVGIADNAFDDEPEIADEFYHGGKIGRSVPKLTGRLQVLATLVEKHQPALSAWGLQPAMIVEVKDIVAALEDANVAQERAMTELPAKTRELYLAKGRLYLLLKKLARAGRTVFAGDPTLTAKLNLDILNRKGSRRKTAEQPSAS